MFSQQALLRCLVVSFLLMVSVGVVSSSPANQADNNTYDSEMWVTNPCMSPPETVYLTGTTHVVTQVQDNGTRTWGFFHINDNFEGVGETSGSRYVYRGVFNQSGYADNNFEDSHIVVNASNVTVSMGSAPNFVLHFEYRFLLRDGELVLENTSWRSECVG